MVFVARVSFLHISTAWRVRKTINHGEFNKPYFLERQVESGVLKTQEGNFFWYVTQYISEKPKNILNLGHFGPQKYTQPKNIPNLGHF